MTFSIVGKCEKTNMFGVAISSSSIAVASRCPWVRSKVGAVTTQNITDPSLGKTMLDFLEKGFSAKETIDKITNETKNINYRQLAIIDISGNTAGFSGSNILGKHSISSSSNCIAAGNLLKNENVTNIMVDFFANNKELQLAERLIKSLEAGLDSGGEEGPVNSAGIKVAFENSWPIVDLRVDWKENEPIKELYKIWKNYEPQMNDYQSRALNPSKAPSYGVPGDEF